MVAVYETTTGETKVIIVPTQPVDAIDDFVKTTLKATLKYCFNEKDSLSNNVDEESFFRNNCCYYGLKPDDFHKEFYNQKGHKIRIEGLLPRNRKYGIRIYDFTTEKYYKVTPSYFSMCKAVA
jgi:hypothetical protein